MAAAAVAGGTRVLAATSHVNRGFALLPEDLAPAREQVAARLREEGIPLEVVQGGEVSIARVERPRRGGPARAHAGRRAVAAAGVPARARRRRRWSRSWPPCSSAACGSCSPTPSAPPPSCAPRGRSSGWSGWARSRRSRRPRSRAASATSSRKVAFEMLERGHAHVIASDAHGADGRPPDLHCALEALERRYEDPRALFDWMTDGVPGRDPGGRPAAAPPAAAAQARRCSGASSAQSLTIAIVMLASTQITISDLHPDPERGHPPRR